MENVNQTDYSKLLEFLKQFILNTDNGWIIRLIIVSVFSIGLLFIFMYYLRTTSKIVHTLKKTFNNDFFYPTGFVYLIILLESYLEFIMKNSVNSIFYILSFGIFLVYLIKWIINKFFNKLIINEVFFNLVAVSLTVFVIYRFPIDEFSVHHLLFEIIAIFFTFFIYFTREVILENKKANSIEETFWDEYKTKLANVETSIITINTEKYSEFTESIGFRYLAEQLKVFGNIENNHLKKQRFFIVSAKNPKYSEEIASFSTEKLSDKTRNFKSLYLLHSLFGIEMYLIPKEKVINIINQDCNWIYRLWNTHIKKTWKDLDRLIIDNNYYKVDDRGNSLIFDPNDKNSKIILELISEFATDAYNVEKLKVIEQAPNDLILEIKNLKEKLIT
jgi:hypothetical protein